MGNKMNLKILLRIGIFLLFSFLMIFDYFPHLVLKDIPKTALTIGMVPLAVVYIVINRKTEKNCENSLIGEAVFIFYVSANRCINGNGRKIYCRNLFE